MGEESRGSLPGCWAGCLPALARASARLPGKLLITWSLLSPLLAGTGPLRVPPCRSLPSLLAHQPPPPQLLLVGASSPGAPSARDAPTAKNSSVEEPPLAPRHTYSAEAADCLREGWGWGPGSARTPLQLLSSHRGWTGCSYRCSGRR